MEQTRRRRFAKILIPVIVGLSGLFSLINRPRFQAYHTVDVLELLACGMCFGIALVWLLLAFRGPMEG
jgi:membrane protein CcdC involved in cytochrome C biogenesis